MPSYLPRIALGVIQATADPAPMLWALVHLLKSRRRQVQLYHDQARFFADEAGAQVVCGHNPGYLDSWLMSPELCRESFVVGAGSSNFAIVYGRYGAGRWGSEPIGGNLEDLCNWLDLPPLVVVDVSQIAECRLPSRLEGAAGLLLDRVPAQQIFRWQTILESLWGIPVLGHLPELSGLRAKLSAPNFAGTDPAELCGQLGAELAKSLQWERLIRLASERESLVPVPKMFLPGNKLAGLRVAIAYDEAINRYFPSVLDILELQGAEVQDFSPLHDEALPPECDVVYFGCGHPERYAARLARNHCMKLALQNHVRQGRRIFAEAGGLTYLCQSAILATGEALPMSGVFPAVAVEHSKDVTPRAVEVTLAHHHWLGRAGSKLRGYLNPRWQFESNGTLNPCIAEPGCESYLAAYREAVGSRLHINFAAHPEFLRRFSLQTAQALV